MHQNPRRRRGYSMLMVLMLMALLGVAVGGLFAVILRGGRTSGAMIDRRTTFYACDGMGRQLAALGQAFLSRNTLEDVPESRMERELRESLPLITPAGFSADPRDLVIPDRELPVPAPIEMITTGPFSGLEVKLQVIDMRFAAKRIASGAVCRTEQTLSLGRIALFQFFVFADLPLLDIVQGNGDDGLMMLRGRIHTNGRTCLGGAARPNASGVEGPFSLRLDANVTAVDRILDGRDRRCPVGRNDVGIIGNRAPTPALPPPEPDRLLDFDLFERFDESTQSGCTQRGAGAGATCPGGWRAFTLRTFLGRLADKDHEVQELTLPVDPPEQRSQRGFSSQRGVHFAQRMNAGPSRPNTRFLVEPLLTNDPTGFGRNKLAFKAQIRIIDGVWYVKDPGENNDIAVDGDDGPWPGIPIWSDHPGEFTTARPEMGREGVEGATPIEVGQSDIRNDLEARSDARISAHARWSARRAIGASPTPRRFSYYAFVDRQQARQFSSSQLSPRGMGLQFGRVRHDGEFDVDPPAVVSYGGIVPVFLNEDARFIGSSSFFVDSGPPTSGDQPYWLPGVRLTDDRFDVTRRTSYSPRPGSVGFCGGRSNQFAVDEVASNVMLPAVPQPLQRSSDDGTTFFTTTGYPARGEPLPSDGTRVDYNGNDNGSWFGGRLCEGDTGDAAFRKRMRLALLEGTRTGFLDTNANNELAQVSPNVLPLNFNMHAFQEALADKTPGELGSFFCEGCLWERFEGTVFITNTWKGGMLGADRFPEGIAAPPPNPVIDDRAVVGENFAQPRAPKEDRSTTGPLPYPLCGDFSDEESSAFAQVVGHRFLEADETNFGAGLDTTLDAPFLANGGTAGRDTFRRKITRPPTPPGASPPDSIPSNELPDDVETGASQITGSFRITECASYSLRDGPYAAVRPTAVRVINARSVAFNRATCGNGRNQRCQPQLSNRALGLLKNGFNLLSNVPVYVVGDVNQTSEIDEVETGKKATDWLPLLIGGDTVTTLSNGWDDEQARWNVRADNGNLNILLGATNRKAKNTRYTMLVLTGLVGAGAYDGRAIRVLNESGGGLPSALRLMEDWDNRRHTFRGSMVLGWMPVFTQWRAGAPGPSTSRPPEVRDWQFDRHLNATVNQPPDSPVFDVTALRSWRRE